MEIVNLTSCLIAPLIGRIGFPGYSLTLIVKGPFDLVHNGKAKIAKDQLFPTGDVLYPDDDEGQGSRFYESDFAYYKPRTDLLLTGKCHVPGGRPVQACKASFSVGGRSKSLGVFGNRYWNTITRTITDPEPFRQMELRYENSFGGPGFDKNPVGKGASKIRCADGETRWPLPNIEDLNDLVASPGSRPDPAGFGPIGGFWPQRRSKLGTYKGSWLKERWPWYPTDFDWGYFNAAPIDMQIEGYLKGDEPLFFENLHPRISAYHSRLPGIKPRLFIYKRDPADRNRFLFIEAKLNLDTLWVDMETEKLVLVWRTVFPVLSEEYDEISDVFIVSERLEDTPQTKEFYHRLFLKQTSEQDKMPGEDIGLPDEDPAFVDDIDVEEEIKKADTEIRAALTAAGIDPDREIPEPTEEDRQEEARIIKELGIEEMMPESPLTREKIIERIARGEGFSGEDLGGLDLSGLDMHGIDFIDAVLDGVNLKEAILASCNFKNVTLSKADLSSVDLKGAVLKDADASEAMFAGADLRGADFRDAVFDQADLRHALLDDCNAENASFCEADLTGASLTNSRCRAADFSRSNLSGADLANAILVEASVEDAKGPGVNMSGADLSGLRASGKTDFTGGNFQKAVGPYSIWEHAILDQADFSLSVMEGANFASASLKSANFVGADLKYARLSKANLRQARCMTMNLFEASLEKADLTMTDFRASNIYGAEFLDAALEGARFEHANLKMTKLARK
jgi:uncharacterized protein YjbI with pentapeptide repeats